MSRVRNHFYKLVYVILIIALIFIAGTQYSRINRYEDWVSNDLKNILAGVGRGILSNKEILSYIVQTKEMTIEQADQIKSNSRSIYEIRELQEFATQVLGYEFTNNPSQTWSSILELRKNVEQLLSQKDRLHNNKITLTEEELRLFQYDLQLHKQWVVVVQKTYQNISQEGASTNFFREHRDMIKNRDWIPFIKKLFQVSLEFH